MSDLLSEIKKYHEKIVGTAGRMEALKEVRTSSCSLENPAIDIFAPNPTFSLSVVEHKRVEDVSTFLSDWVFPGRLQNDFPDFLETLNWGASSWEEIKKLSDDIMRVAVRVAEYENGSLLEPLKKEFAKYLENLQTISKVLYDLEEKALNEESRLAQVNAQIAEKVEALNRCIRECGIRPSPRFSKDSILIPETRQRLLVSWFPGQWDLIYRGTRDGMNPAAFHSICDGRGPTVTIVQCGQNISGGYTKEPWAGGGNGRYVSDDTASVFLLSNAQGIEPVRFPVKKGSPQAAFHYSLNGPSFGHDLMAFNNNTTNCYSVLGTRYAVPPGTSQYLLTGGGQQHVLMTEIEVFALRTRLSGSTSAASSAS
uniref:TLDc domain-containing protein n=1 Tax=Chromera velia CCMP2878 TaxID=1169474 RepID=A0A0G4G1G9_9ALVE|eukprot:Cvel_19756.t1-p1 / transcript=Cvel_19756.t1 / gene=Cvel_19756 / organism=Chromera_velia_CCMP2878 / gene_product=hypothetical protein / transcript_product=hypothetical protein / location=Cvel_scaffold1730:22009-23109(-) / protein_length=367 / sequence_SO=supercontig / SO=protein_coding / is_pseudo=false